MAIEFKNRFKKISFSQIDLKEFFKFYKEICLYKYNYVLDNQEEIILFFEENNFSHLLGLHKFKKIKSYKYSNDINKDIENYRIEFSSLIKEEPFVLNKELRDRLTYFPVLRTLLENVAYSLNRGFHSLYGVKEENIFILNLTFGSCRSLYGAKKIFHSIVGNKDVYKRQI